MLWEGASETQVREDKRRLAASVVDGILLLQLLHPVGLLVPDSGDEDEEDGTANGIAEDVNDEDNIGGGVGVKLWERRLCNENDACCPPEENIEDGW